MVHKACMMAERTAWMRVVCTGHPKANPEHANNMARIPFEMGAIDRFSSQTGYSDMP
jgi:hypothetical protein